MPKRPIDKPSPFDGIIYSLEPGSPSPYRVRYYVPKVQPNGRLKSVAVRRRFESEALRDDWAFEENRKRLELGRVSKSLDPTRLKQWEVADYLIGPNVDPVEVANFWNQAHTPKHVRTKPKARAARILDEFIEAKEKSPAFEANKYNSIFARFKAKFGPMDMDALEQSLPAFKQWIDELPFAETTKRNHWIRISAALNWAVDARRISKNPLAGVKRPKNQKKEIGFLPIEDIETLFRSNFDRPGTCAKLSLEIHGGMRTSAVSRVEHRDLKFSSKGIETPAWKTKTDSRQFIQGYPACLWQWLERATPAHFADPSPKSASETDRIIWKRKVRTTWMHEKSEALIRAGLKIEKDSLEYKRLGYTTHPPNNWARHGFVTSHANAFRKLEETSWLISHELGTNTIRKHYLGIETQERAEKLFRIDPGTIQKTINSLL